MEKQYHSGVMRTTVDDCQFVCIAQEHYYRILTQGKPKQTAAFMNECSTILMFLKEFLYLHVPTVTPRPEAHMDMILFEVFLKNIHLFPQDQIVK